MGNKKNDNVPYVNKADHFDRDEKWSDKENEFLYFA